MKVSADFINELLKKARVMITSGDAKEKVFEAGNSNIRSLFNDEEVWQVLLMDK